MPRRCLKPFESADGLLMVVSACSSPATLALSVAKRRNTGRAWGWRLTGDDRSWLGEPSPLPD